MKKTLLTLSVLALSTSLLAGCGGSGNNSAASEDYKLENVTLPLKEKVTLHFMTQSSPLAPSDPNEKLIYKRLEEKTGVHIDFTNFTSDSFIEKRNLAVASGDLPDAILDAGYSDYDLLNLGKDGTIIPLEDLIQKYMPNLQKVLKEAPEYRSMITAQDGHIYAFPWIEELGSEKESIHSVNDMPWINVEWLKKLGLKMPKTTEDLKKVLLAFKNGDPNGNGQADEIPLSFMLNNGNEDLNFLFGSFGLGDNGDHTVVTNEGKVVFTADQDGYKEGIKYLNELYKLNLIDEESFEQDYNTYLAKGQSERYGLYFQWDKANISGDNDKYELMNPLAGPSGEVNVTRTNNLGFDRGRMVITSDNQNLELTAKWIDQLYDPIQSVQDNWGTYGDKTQQNIFEYDEASHMLKHLPLKGTAPVELRQKTNIGGPLAILDEYYGTVTTKPDDAVGRLKLMKERLVPYMKADHNFPKVFFSLEDQKQISTLETDLFAYVNRKRAEWIKTGKVEEEWAEYKAELSRLGLDKWLEIKQKGYDRYLKDQS
ncbi:ABC transporter substrate-binding protein [Paenibacillus sp. SEL3]|jgi:putative aldouronate transport system substrate-binding protein|uniref:ABC transporter substrate-binding protein n=1 Tax=Paenibacillus polymyxa TaxID=1406 RepID=A0A8I1IXT4_PAEPO|nr:MULTISPECIES: ABC transporter substrate-binding protein [Paenibacillus]KAF6573812.1 extracellular solute-binding protein [Paenibacillus sp. EKM206P]KAF6588303.1 extracellular solute-binding protein [Paenibacillus sp. EKM205P]MBM0634670.1 ABC transporter substrate-binding protein [Paenibacillus polymyxa]MBO3282987.1 ABC transporter substrate-binding protein [Paenibacillus polymyxa]MBP1309525.1 putative aldouronate transport system substrate-binding protein [Paenibacillus sp. 1182]